MSDCLRHGTQVPELARRWASMQFRVRSVHGIGSMGNDSTIELMKSPVSHNQVILVYEDGGVRGCITSQPNPCVKSKPRGTRSRGPPAARGHRGLCAARGGRSAQGRRGVHDHERVAALPPARVLSGRARGRRADLRDGHPRVRGCADDAGHPRLLHADGRGHRRQRGEPGGDGGRAGAGRRRDLGQGLVARRPGRCTELTGTPTPSC
jgi:hypothetical protein